MFEKVELVRKTKTYETKSLLLQEALSDNL